MSKYEKGTEVWVRPTLVDKPLKAVYIRSVTEDERKAGYREGEIVRLESGREVWVRGDLCGTDFNKVANNK